MRNVTGSKWALVALVCSLPFVQGSSGMCVNVPLGDLTGSIDRINDTMSQAVKTLGDQSSQWQATLQNLEAQLALDVKGIESQLVADVKGLIDHVDYIAKDGVQFMQESLNCQTDIWGAHARIAVENLLIDFLNKWNFKGISNRPNVPRFPIVCSANPTGVNVGTWDLTGNVFLALSGADLNLFDTEEPLVVVVKAGGPEVTVAHMGNRQTNYRYVVNVPSLITQGYLKDAVQIQVRWKGQRVNNNDIPVSACGKLGAPCCHGACDQGSCVNGLCGTCGALGQACCNGATCNAGGRCVNNTCAACGGINQVCCAGNACSSGKCVGNICTRILPACQWTADISEEPPAHVACPSGFAARGARCFGGNCDNVALYCCPYSDAADPGATFTQSVWFSEEGTGRPYAPNQSTSFVSGISCRGGNCDDLKLDLLRTSKVRFLGQCIQGPWFSEENPNHQECADGQWVGGMACRGANCDDISLFCCRGEPQ